MISIYTRTNNPFKKEFWKYVAKKAIRKYTGPDAVADSLKRGLSELGLPFEVNPLIPKYDIVHVISGTTVLKEMIAKKTKGKIRTLLAGPTLVQTPFDHDNIIQDPNIDALLFPSQWTKDFYVSLVPSLSKKIRVWPAGVQIPKEVSSKKKALIFKKNVSKTDFNQIIKIIEGKDIPYDILTYGTYSKNKYHEALSEASILIYLQYTESQGLALQEAWSYDVPTLVLKSTTWKGGTYEWSDEKISAPYLTDATGIFFTLETLDSELTAVANHSYAFKPKEYCSEFLSDTASAKKYLEIIKNIC
jgi:hypothetical protein